MPGLTSLSDGIGPSIGQRTTPPQHGSGSASWPPGLVTPHRDDRPDRLDHAERPRPGQEAVGRRGQAAGREGQDERRVPPLQRVHHHHERDCHHAIQRDQCLPAHRTGPPARLTRTPRAAAPTMAVTTPRRSPISQPAASTSTPACHRCVRAAASGMAAPAIAPIAAGPAPVRKACTAALRRSRSKCRPAPRTTQNDGANATSEASSPPPTPAAAYPTTATVCTTGPGVTWPSATAVRNVPAL